MGGVRWEVLDTYLHTYHHGYYLPLPLLTCTPMNFPRSHVNVTVTVEEYAYVKNHRLEFSSILSAAIRARMRADGEEPEAATTVPTFEEGPKGDLRRWIAEKNAAHEPIEQEELAAKRHELGLDAPPPPELPPGVLPDAERKAAIRKALEEAKAAEAARKAALQ